MQAGNVGWGGQAFALASSSDSGGKKSRIRRSKEERKSMVESFIKKYQESNNGHFPSLNLAHKEVGGSFYTVREIVREIIQENRVLAPPRVSLEEHGLSKFLEQHPLGSISMEPIIDLPVSDRGDVTSHIAPNEIHFPSAANDGASDGMSESHQGTNHFQDNSLEEVSNTPQSKSHKLEESIVNGIPVVDGSPLSDKPLMKSADHHCDIDEERGSQLLSNEKYHIKNDQTADKDKEFGSPLSDEPLLKSADHHCDIDEERGSQILSNEKYHIKNDQTVDKDKEFGRRIHAGTTTIETLDQEKLEVQHVESSPSIKPHKNSDLVVETFPLRPVPRTVNNMAEESGNLHEAAQTSVDKGIEQELKTSTQGSSSLVSEESDIKLPDSTVELNGENSDAKVVVPRGLSLENDNHPSAFKPSVLNVDSVGELESKNSLPDGAKASISTKTWISEDSTTVGGKSSDRDNSSEAKGNNSTLDRINLETWDRAGKKPPQPESNPLLALVKAIISSFVKFWTEE